MASYWANFLEEQVAAATSTPKRAERVNDIQSTGWMLLYFPEMLNLARTCSYEAEDALTKALKHCLWWSRWFPHTQKLSWESFLWRNRTLCLSILVAPAITELVKEIWMCCGIHRVLETTPPGQAKSDRPGRYSLPPTLPVPWWKDPSVLSSSLFCSYLMNCILKAGLILFIALTESSASCGRIWLRLDSHLSCVWRDLAPFQQLQSLLGE